MWRAVAVATGGGGGNNGGTEGRELFEGIVVVGHWSLVPPSLNPNVSKTHLFSFPHGRALTVDGRASMATMTTVVDWFLLVAVDEGERQQWWGVMAQAKGYAWTRRRWLGEGGRRRRSAGVGFWCVIIVDVVLWKVHENE
jgi:hypothetical protein